MDRAIRGHTEFSIFDIVLGALTEKTPFMKNFSINEGGLTLSQEFLTDLLDMVVHETSYKVFVQDKYTEHKLPRKERAMTIGHLIRDTLRMLFREKAGPFLLSSFGEGLSSCAAHIRVRSDKCKADYKALLAERSEWDDICDTGLFVATTFLRITECEWIINDAGEEVLKLAFLSYQFTPRVMRFVVDQIERKALEEGQKDNSAKHTCDLGTFFRAFDQEVPQEIVEHEARRKAQMSE